MMVAGLAAVRTFSLKNALAQSNARYKVVFESAGISIYLEDWGAFGRAVMSLRRRSRHGVAFCDAARSRAHTLCTSHDQEWQSLRR
jgi:hypothetical protein